jgi:hypothetical protein
MALRSTNAHDRWCLNVNLRSFGVRKSLKQVSIVANHFAGHVRRKMRLLDAFLLDQNVRPIFGLSGLWQLYEKAVGAACWDVRFQLFRTVTFATHFGTSI